MHPLRLPSRPRALRALLVVLLVMVVLLTTASAPVASTFDGSFDTAWRLVAERYWNLERTGVDWDEVGDRYRPEALAAADDDAFFAVLERMYEALGDDHPVFVPPDRVAEIRRRYGDLPCIAVFGSTAAPAPATATRPDVLAVAGSWGHDGVATEATIANVTFGRTPDGIGYLRLPDLA